MNNKPKYSKKIRTIIALMAISFGVLVGSTFAYFSSSATFQNVFTAGKYKVVTTEEFVSPDNWAPGEEIPKTITTENQGTIDAAVRVKFQEKWETPEGADITNQVAANTVIINMDNTNEWIRQGDYYYYKFPLKPGETTSSFIKSVTMSSTVNDVVCTPSNDGKSQTCESTNAVSGAVYKLIITKETAQYSAYSSVWQNAPTLSERVSPTYVTRQVSNQITAGDEICIEDECFNVISSDANNVTMLAKYNLNVGNNIQTGTQGIQNINSIGWNSDNSTMDESYNYPSTVAFASQGNWTTVETYPANVYSYSTIGTYINNYKGYLQGLGARIQDARLLSYTESSSNPSFLRNTSFWLSDAADSFRVYEVSISTGLYRDACSNAGLYGVRPVIVIPINTIVEN